MTDDGNIVELGKAIETAVAKVQSELPYGVELERVADQPTVVSESVWEFERSLMEALAIVLAVCLLSLGWRTGIVVGLSVPIVLGVVALVMLAMGWNLERVSLGSLIIALGLLVDDGIIAVEMMVVKMEEGWDRVKAAAFSYAVDRDAAAHRRAHHRRRVHADRLLQVDHRRIRRRHFLDRRHGRRVLVVRLGGDHALPRGQDAAEDFKKHDHGGDPYDSAVLSQAARLDRLRHRATLVGHRRDRRGICRSRSSGSRLVPQQFFPNSDRPELVVELRLKEGASFAATTEQVKKMEAVLAKDEDVRFFTAYTGAGQPRFYLSLNPELPNPGYAVFIVMTKDMEARERVRSRLMASVNEQFPDVWVRVTRLELGPPVGFPVQFRVVGPDTQKVREIAREVEAVVAASPKVRDVQLDWNDPVRTLRVDVDQDKARALGLAPADVAFVTQTRHERRDDVAVARARRPDRHRRPCSAVRAAQPRHAEGRQSLHARGHGRAAVAGRARAQRARRAGAVAAQSRHGDHRARRRQGRRAGRVGDQRDPAALEGHRSEAAVGLSHRRRRRRRGKRQGQQARWRRSFPVMLVTILTILMLQLQSFSKMFMVLLTAPLGLIGVVAALLIFQAPLGFVAILGVTALCGMIMRNSVILVDQVQKRWSWASIRGMR